jgi:hypothetical protein
MDQQPDEPRTNRDRAEYFRNRRASQREIQRESEQRTALPALPLTGPAWAPGMHRGTDAGVHPEDLDWRIGKPAEGHDPAHAETYRPSGPPSPRSRSPENARQRLGCRRPTAPRSVARGGRAASFGTAAWCPQPPRATTPRIEGPAQPLRPVSRNHTTR